MKVKELTRVMTNEQNVMIVPNIGDCGFYRYMVKNIPPTFLNAEVRNVTSHGAEIMMTVTVR